MIEFFKSLAGWYMLHMNYLSITLLMDKTNYYGNF